MKNVVVAVVTKPNVFTDGSADVPFTYMVRKAGSDGSTDRSIKSMDKSATFTDLEAGDYVAVVSKLGFESSADFSITSDEVSIDVPDTIKVTVG